jgi:hypothetical protein
MGEACIILRIKILRDEHTMEHKDMDVVAHIWNKTTQSPTCPRCGAALTIVQIEPLYDAENAYVPYNTIIECTSCDFNLETISFSILGAVRDYDANIVEIASWSPTGSRVISQYKHILSYELLKKLKKTEELTEFLIVNNQVIQVIG